MFYSKTTNGFYDSTINSVIPPDAVEISQELYRSLLDGQSAGQTITSDPNGNPILVSPESLLTLPQVQAVQINALFASYNAQIAEPVNFQTTTGVSQTYDADAQSVNNVANMLLAYSASKTLPTGFYWVAADNTQVPFVYADLEGLATAIGNRGWATFQQLQTLKAAVLAATTVKKVTAITWS